jgi:hypothetical protein
LYGLIPAPLQRWTGEPSDPDDRDRLANNLLMELTVVSGAPIAEDDQEGFAQAVVISEAPAGFVCQWGWRYGNFADDVDRAQVTLVTAQGGRVLEPGGYQLRVGTPLTVVAIAHLIGWVTILEVPEP